MIPSFCRCQVNQIYWGVLSGTVLTWILAVVAAVDGGWMTIAGVKVLSLKTDAFACALDGAWGLLDDSLEETMDGACSICEFRMQKCGMGILAGRICMYQSRFIPLQLHRVVIVGETQTMIHFV